MVASRFGKTILELGGNNASIVMADADLDMAYKGSVFAAAGTCG
jgi:acyl-CoA reductase-like NAD-dependent aldehyde dehydrogenase